MKRSKTLLSLKEPDPDASDEELRRWARNRWVVGSKVDDTWPEPVQYECSMMLFRRRTI